MHIYLYIHSINTKETIETSAKKKDGSQHDNDTLDLKLHTKWRFRTKQISPQIYRLI